MTIKDKTGVEIKKSKGIKGKKTLAVLDAILGFSLDTVEIFMTVALGDYTDMCSTGKFSRILEQAGGGNDRYLRDLADYTIEKRKFSKLIYKLKKEGLIEQSGNKWLLTKRGKSKRNELRERVDVRVCQKAGDTKIIIFDIPEHDRRKRDWLRQSLENLGFEILQKSVWKGDIKLPKKFIKDLKKRELLPHVHIFSVKESGTIID